MRDSRQKLLFRSQSLSPQRIGFHTVCSTLGDWLLATSTTNSDTVNDIALLGLVTKTASLIRARRTGSAVDDVQLSELFTLSANALSTSV